MKIYAFEVKWYCDWEDKEIISHGIVPATNYSDVTDKLDKRFTYIESISIERVSEDEYIWLSKENYDKIRDNNDFLDEITVSEDEDDF